MTKETTYTNSRDNKDTKIFHDLQISLHEVERDIYKLKHDSRVINIDSSQFRVAKLIRDELLVRIQEQLSSFSDDTLVKLTE